MIDKKYITHSREPYFQIALDFIKSDSVVLDIGSGNGEFSRFCNRLDFHHFDGNEQTIKELSKQYNNCFLGNLPELPFKNNEFDLVHCSHIVEHLQPQELYDTILEIDRVLKPSGYLIISAPLMWSGFYNDLSHIKPYNPFVFEKYLCGTSLGNLTRMPISVSYQKVKLQYRYYDSLKNWIVFNSSGKVWFRILHSILYRLKKNGLTNLEKTGYTLVLKKIE